jgi:hypothetical protein
MTRRFYDLRLLYRGNPTGQGVTASLDFEDADETEDKLARLMASAIRRDGGGSRDLGDYLLEVDDGVEDTPSVLFATNQWLED